MGKEKISTFYELGDAIQAILDNPTSASIEDFDRFDISLEPISIHIEDKEHPSAMSAAMLSAISEYQSLVYKAVKIAKYGDTSKRLSEEDKTGFDLYVSFKQGSIFSDIDLQPILESAVDKMNGWHIFGAFAFAVLIWFGYRSFKVYSDNKRISRKDFLEAQQRIRESEEKTEIAKANARTIENISKLAEEVTMASSATLETLATVNGTVSINGKQYSRRDLIDLSRKNRYDFLECSEVNSDKAIKQKIVSGVFMVSRIELDVDDSQKAVSRRSINLMDTKTGEVFKDIEISGENMTAEQRRVIMDAVDGRPLMMKMSIAYSDIDTIESVLIIECNGASMNRQ